MKSASSNKNAANQHRSNSSDNKSSKRGTSSFSSKVPRFPSDKVSVGPSPGQYDPTVKEKIKGAVPLSKQLPRTKGSAVPGETPSRLALNPTSDHSSGASFHSTRERSSSGSTVASTKTISRPSSTKTSLHAPFAPLKRSGIVKPAASEEATDPAPDPDRRPSATPPPSTDRTRTPDGLRKTGAANRPARLTSGNPVPGGPVVRKTPARPVTAGAYTARTGTAVVKPATRASSATPRPKSRSRSPPHATSRSRSPPAARGGLSPRRPRAAVSPAPRRKSMSPSQKEQLEIKKELNELMARKQAQSGSVGTGSGGGRSRSGSESEETTARRRDNSSECSPTTTGCGGGGSPRSSYARSSTTPTASRSSSSTAGSSSQQDVSVYQSSLWSESMSSRTSTPADETEMETRIRRLSANSNQSDRTTTSWMETDRAQQSADQAAPQQQQQVDAAHYPISPTAEYSSLTYIRGDEPLRTPLMSCVRRYFASPPSTICDDDHDGDDESVTSPASAMTPDEDASLYDLAYAPPLPAEEVSPYGFAPPLPMDFKPFMEGPPQDAYVSNMFEVFTAGLVAANAPPLHIGDHGYRALPPDMRPAQEMTCQPIMEVTEPSTASTTSSTGKSSNKTNKTNKTYKKEPTPRQQQQQQPPAKGKTTTTAPPASKNAAATPKSRALAAKARVTPAAKSQKKVNETESFPKAEAAKKKCSNASHSFTTPQPDTPQVIIKKGNKYYLPARAILSKSTLKDTAGKPKPVAPSHPKRARTLDAVERNGHASTTRTSTASSKRRSSSAPTKAEVADARRHAPPPTSVEDAEVELSTTSYEEDAQSILRLLGLDEHPKMDKEDCGRSARSGNSSCGGEAYDIDVVCSENNLTITAMEKRSKSGDRSKSRKSRPNESIPPAAAPAANKSIKKAGKKGVDKGKAYDLDVVCSENNLSVTAKKKHAKVDKLKSRKSRPGESILAVKSIGHAGKKKEAKSSMKSVASDFRSDEKRPRPRSSPRPATNAKSRGSTRSSSMHDSETPRLHVTIREAEVPHKREQHSYASSDPESESQAQSHRSNSSRPSSSGGHPKDAEDKQSAAIASPPKKTPSDSEKVNAKPEQQLGNRKEVESNQKYDIELPKLPDHVETKGTKPAKEYVKESIYLLDVIPLTAQKISESFHKMLDGMRAYLTDSCTNLKRNELQEHLMTYINEADGNAFYIRQEVKTELHRCVTQINANLQELLYLNNCAHEERQTAQKRIEALHVRELKLSNGIDEFRRLNESIVKKCDDWAYKCRKEQETRKFIEGSKELVEKEVTKQRKELREAEDEVARLRREIKQFETKLDEMKKMVLQRDSKFVAKIKMEERTSQLNVEMLAKIKDEKSAMQRTLHQMNESHIRLNNQNMAKIQDLERQLKEAAITLESERDDMLNLERKLAKKDDYLKLVEGATINLVRQTNPGRELPSMPEDFGLNEREVSVWEQLNLCRGRLADLETENDGLRQEQMVLLEKINEMEHMYQWVQENEGQIKASQNEFTILEQPNAELVEEMEQMRNENKDLKERLTAREKHCSLAHEKIEKLQDLLNSLRISETEDADRVEVATLQHQVAELKASMREMLERTKELDLRCASQEIQLKQRDFYAHNQQRLLETRNQVIEVLKVKGRDVSTMESLMGFGDTWRKSSEPRLSLSGTTSAESGAASLHLTPSQLANVKNENRVRIRELEELVLKLEHDETRNHETRVRLENTIADLELKLLKAERAKYYRTSSTCLST